jgi:hypothetical protein
MIARARRAFPGMVVSMLLAGQALAGTQAADTTTTHPRKAPHPALEHKRPASLARSAAAGRTPAREQARLTFVEDTSVWTDNPAAGPGLFNAVG